MSIAVDAGGVRIPVASEGGHADFAPTTGREVKLLEALVSERGRVEWEDLLSGPGLSTLHRFTHDRPCAAVPADLDTGARPAAISAAALEKRCASCVNALELFVAIYGSAAGGLALTAAATGGLYIGGGIAPKILPALVDGPFMAAFRNKPPMDDLLARMPVRVILNPEAALLGAATALMAAGARS
jgi:glucokinase